MSGYVLAIDQGTTSTRAIVFNDQLAIAGVGQQEFTQYYPAPGWVEHDAEEIWRSVLATAQAALTEAGITASDVAAAGITNQRETVVVWDRSDGRPVHRAIVWQDRRTADLCAELKSQGLEHMIAERTGLCLDPYFSATKLSWLFANIDGLRERAEAGGLCFGTIDSWILWNLTGGRVHATDATNASRTMLYDINEQRWDPELLGLFDIPASMLPEALDCADDFGTADPALLGAAIPIAGAAGDQQAAAIGNACFSEGMTKATYGTGCFVLCNTGAQPVKSRSGLLTTVAWRLDGKAAYALEGSIFAAGAAVQWLRDGLGIIAEASQSGKLAEEADDGQSVFLVPAFTGLGAPHWDPDARGALYGLTRNTGPRELARAALESVGFQTADLMEAIQRDWPPTAFGKVLRADGGMVASDWTMQRLADLVGAPVDRPKILETTALGAAWLAGSKTGVWPDRDGFAAQWALDRRFEPAIDDATRNARVAAWRDAVDRTRSVRR